MRNLNLFFLDEVDTHNITLPPGELSPGGTEREKKGKRKMKRWRKFQRYQESEESKKQWETVKKPDAHLMTDKDMEVVNLSKFPLNQKHINLHSKGLSFSPTASMNEFTVFKDLNLFLHKVIFQLWHTGRKGEDDSEAKSSKPMSLAHKDK